MLLAPIELEYCVSRLSSPDSAGSVPGTAWIRVMLDRLCDTPAIDQKLVRSLVLGNVSMTMAVVVPAPVLRPVGRVGVQQVGWDVGDGAGARLGQHVLIMRVVLRLQAVDAEHGIRSVRTGIEGSLSAET